MNDAEAIAELRRRYRTRLIWNREIMGGEDVLNTDPATSHKEADGVMFELLRESHPEFVALVESLTRWYE